MFNLFNKNDKEIMSPANGKIISLDEVKDPMFAQKMMGDGFAIKLESDYIVSPINGVVILVFPTNHAIGLRSNDGIEVLVHIGLDTVNEGGKGFECFVNVGDKVKKGTTLVKVNRNYLEGKGYDLTTPCIVTNMDSIKNLQVTYEKNAVGGRTLVAKYE